MTSVARVGRDRRWLSVGLLSMVALVAFEAMAVTTIMPTVAGALDGVRWYALAFAAPLASGIPGMVVAGSWSDRSGPRAPLLTGLGLFSGGLLVQGFAPDMAVLIAGRAVQGLGSGMLAVALYAVVGRAYPEQEHPRVFASFSAAWILPALVGPLLASWLLAVAGWRPTFLVVPVLALVAVWPVARHVRPVSRTGAVWDRRRTLWGSAAGIAVLVIHLTAREHGLTLLAVVPAVVLLGAGARTLLPRGSFTAARGLPSVLSLRASAAAALVSAESFLPLLLVREREWSPTEAGIVLSLGALSWSAASAVLGRVGDRIRAERVIAVGFLLLLLANLGLVLVATDLLPVGFVVPVWAAQGAGMGTVFPRLSVLGLRLAPRGAEGSSGGALQLSESMGEAVALGACGPVFSYFLLDSPSTGYAFCFAVAAGLSALGLMLSSRVSAPSRGATEVLVA